MKLLVFLQLKHSFGQKEKDAQVLSAWCLFLIGERVMQKMIFDSTTVALVFQEERDESILIVGINEFQHSVYLESNLPCVAGKRETSTRDS